jgi:hypothetical protein
MCLFKMIFRFVRRGMITISISTHVSIRDQTNCKLLTLALSHIFKSFHVIYVYIYIYIDIS